MIPDEVIMSKIIMIRGQKVMISNDLSELYGVTTKRLNEQVKRNIRRFPDHFMFQLTENEKENVVANCDHPNKTYFSIFTVTSAPFNPFDAALTTNEPEAPFSALTITRHIPL